MTACDQLLDLKRMLDAAEEREREKDRLLAEAKALLAQVQAELARLRGLSVAA